MSVINSMLRDLDRRHAPLPVKANVLPTLAQRNRALPRSAFAICVLIIVAVWSWSHHSAQTVAKTPDKLPLPAGEGRGEGLSNNKNSHVADIYSNEEKVNPLANVISPTQPALVVALKNQPEKAALTPTPLPQGEGKTAHETKNFIAERTVHEKNEGENQTQTETQNSAAIIKQDRTNPNALNDERYQLARAALTQNQPQRAYELLRDNPPPLASATDYHAVLAAVEQQLGHYADASVRYQQLLLLDQNQASWWLGFALSLEGEHRNSDALAAYQRATQLNSLPDAARQYADSRIAALGLTADKVNAEH